MNVVDLPDDVAALKAIVVAVHARNERLEQLVAAFRQAMFGRKSEKIDPDQFELALEDIETAIATIKAEEEACKLTPKPTTASPRAANRGSLPKHLPRIDEVIEPDTQVCGCGGGLHQIGASTRNWSRRSKRPSSISPGRARHSRPSSKRKANSSRSNTRRTGQCCARSTTRPGSNTLANRLK